MMKKRIFSVLLCLVMAVGLLPTAALAETNWDGWTALTVDADGKINNEIQAGGKYYLSNDLTISETFTISVGGGGIRPTLSPST